MERSPAVNGTRCPRARSSVEPIARPPTEKFSSGPLVAKVRPERSDSSQASLLSGPLATDAYTRFRPTGPRSVA